MIVDGSSRRLLRQLADSTQVIADLSTSANGPWNEIVAHPMGRMYVNGIGFDMMAGEPPTTGVIACVDPCGRARVVAGALAFPNGMDPTGNVIDTIEFDRGCFSGAISPEGELFVTATVWDTDTFSTRRGVRYRAQTRRDHMNSGPAKTLTTDFG